MSMTSSDAGLGGGCRFGAGLRGALWFVVSLTAVVFMTDVSSAHYLPKTLWASVTIALGLALCRPPRAARIELSAVGVAWLAYMGWMLLSLAWAQQPRVGFERWLAVLLPALAYLLARRLRFWESEGLWNAMAVLIILLAILGFLQYVQDYVVRLGGSAHADIVAHYKAFVNWFPGTKSPRVTMGMRNNVSMYLLITLPFFAWRFFARRGAASWLAFAAFVSGVLFVLLARTRSAWVATLLSGFYLLAAGAGPRLRGEVGRLKAVAGAAAVAILLGVGLKPPAEVELGTHKRELQTAIIHILDDVGRLEMWGESLGETHPLIGTGIGNYPIVMTQRLGGESIRTLNWEIHNDYLQAYLELGLPGLLLFLAVFGLLLRTAWRGRADGLTLAAGLAVFSLAFMQMVDYTMEKVDLVVWFAGVAAIVTGRAGGPPARTWRTPPWFRPALNGVAIALLVALAVASAFAIRGDRLFRRAEVRIRFHSRLPAGPEKDLMAAALREEVRWLAAKVFPTMQYNAKMRHVYCNKFTNYASDLGDLMSAEYFASSAFKLHPGDRDCLEFIARRCMETGRKEAAVSILELKLATFGIDPNSDVVSGLIQIYELRGDKEKAQALREAAARRVVAVPSKPVPETRSTGVAVNTRLGWTGGGEGVRYEVYLWKTGEQTPARPLGSKLDRLDFTPPRPLEPDTVYFWQVRAGSRYGEQRGPVWFFRTQKSP